jgi:hypothetical protein
MTDPVDVPGIKPGELPPRPGYEVYVAGECLKPASKFWKEDQREGGVWVRLFYLTSTEEESALGEAQRSGNLAAVGMVQVRVALAGLASNVRETVEVDGEVKVTSRAGTYAKIPALEKRAVWEELGPQGRSLVMSAFNLGNSPSEEARAAAMASFRVTG